MTFITIDLIKQQLRLDCTCEAALLDLYGTAAEQTIANILGHQSVDEMLERFNNNIPQTLVQATLMLVDVSYNHRSPISPMSMSLVPYTFDILVKPYMIL